MILNKLFGRSVYISKAFLTQHSLPGMNSAIYSQLGKSVILNYFHFERKLFSELLSIEKKMIESLSFDPERQS